MDNLSNFLKQLKLFKPLPEEIIDILAAHFSPQKLEKGQYIFHQGDPSNALYIVDEGVINIIVEDTADGPQVVNQIGGGSAIGEMTLVDQDPRTASAAADEVSLVLVLNRDDFMAVLGDLPDGIREEMREISRQLRLGFVDILRRVPFFSELPDKELHRLTEHLERRHLTAGEVLFRQGDTASALYIIDKGTMKIVAQGVGDEEIILNQLGPGEFLGEMSLVEGAPRSAGVVATSESELLRLDRDSFMEFLHDYPSVSLDIIQTQSRRLRFTVSYIQQAIDMSRKIAEGNYNFVKNQIQETQLELQQSTESDESRAAELLSAFFSMVDGVQKREETLKEQVRVLTIQIDEKKRQEEVDTLTGTEFFAHLKSVAQQMRDENENDNDD